MPLRSLIICIAIATPLLAARPDWETVRTANALPVALSREWYGDLNFSGALTSPQPTVLFGALRRADRVLRVIG